MRLTKLVTVALATAALVASGATADPGHGKGKGKPSCKPAPVMLAGTLASDPANGDTSFQLTVKHANRLGRLYAKAGNPVTVNVDPKTSYRKDGGASTLDALAQNDRAGCRASRAEEFLAPEARPRPSEPDRHPKGVVRVVPGGGSSRDDRRHLADRGLHRHARRRVRRVQVRRSADLDPGVP